MALKHDPSHLAAVFSPSQCLHERASGEMFSFAVVSSGKWYKPVIITIVIHNSFLWTKAFRSIGVPVLSRA